jgi:Family of unknown function (DUF6232)
MNQQDPDGPTHPGARNDGSHPYDGTATPPSGAPAWLRPPPSGSSDPVKERYQRHSPASGDVWVTPRTVRLSQETYPLRNISRVSVQTVEWAERPPIREVGPPLALMGLSTVALVATQSSRSSNDLGAVFGLVLALSVLWLIVAIARKRYRTALIIESAGDVSTALISKNPESIHRLEAAILDAIEIPPEQPRLIHIGDVVRGDKIGGNKYQQRDAEPPP